MPTSDYTPTVDQVAALMRSRVKGEYDAATTFTAATRPTAGMVQELIGQAVALIAPQVGFDLDPRFRDSARAVIVLQTALLIEPGYFGEQQGTDRSAWEEWRQLLDRALPALVEAVTRGEDALGDAVLPVFSFPPACGRCGVEGAERPYDCGY